jgi:hypothetical protein
VNEGKKQIKKVMKALQEEKQGKGEESKRKNMK